MPRFRYVETVGRGGMGVVYKAEDLELGETIALKVLFPVHGAALPDLLTRFKREVSLSRRIKHPNVTRLYEFGMSGEFPFITMEFVPGRTLLSWLRRLGRFDPPFAVSVLRQAAQGAHAAHRLGIVHRDLKSANIMVNDEGFASVLDFGLARFGPSGDLTGTHLVGTPEYMAPEQASGKGCDARSDVYALGVVAFEILTGRLPFSGGAPLVTAMRHVNEPIPPTLEEVGIEPALAALVRRLLAKDPAERPAGAGALADALKAFPGAEGLVPPRGGDAASGEHAADAPPTIPVPRSPSRAAARAPATVAKRRHPLVLLVIPDAGERRKLGTAMAEAGCDTHSAGDGAAALETVRTQRIDLIVLDVELPGIDGFDVARILKADARTAGIPILLVAPRLRKAQIAFASQVGAAELVARPLAASTLAWKAWQLLKRAGFVPRDELDMVRTKGRAAFEG